MLERFESYFKEIEMPEALRARAEELCRQLAAILPGTIDRVFVTMDTTRKEPVDISACGSSSVM